MTNLFDFDQYSISFSFLSLLVLNKSLYYLIGPGDIYPCIVRQASITKPFIAEHAGTQAREHTLSSTDMAAWHSKLAHSVPWERRWKTNRENKGKERIHHRECTSEGEKCNGVME